MRTLNGGDILDRGVLLGQVVSPRHGHIDAVQVAEQVARLRWPSAALGCIAALHVAGLHTPVRAGNLHNIFTVIVIVIVIILKNWRGSTQPLPVQGPGCAAKPKLKHLADLHTPVRAGNLHNIITTLR